MGYSGPAAGILLINGSTSGNGNTIDLMGFGKEHTLYAWGVGTITTGDLIWETAPYSTAATWAPLSDPVALSTTTQLRQVTGAYRWMRCRISTNVTGSGGLAYAKLVSTE